MTRENELERLERSHRPAGDRLAGWSGGSGTPLPDVAGMPTEPVSPLVGNQPAPAPAPAKKS